MKICIPVNEDKGLESPVCEHFGSAPVFLIVDSEGGDARAVVNTNQHHGHGMCQPLRALAGESLDGICVGGIGAGAIHKLKAAGITVYKSSHATAGETMKALESGSLPEVTPGMACGGHGHENGGGGCSHGR